MSEELRRNLREVETRIGNIADTLDKVADIKKQSSYAKMAEDLRNILVNLASKGKKEAATLEDLEGEDK